MTTALDESAPNAAAWHRPRHDPWPDVEPVLDPVVVHRRSDTPEQRRCAEALEAATMKAMINWLRGGGR